MIPNIRVAIRVSLCFSIVVLFNTNQGCRDPDEFAPDPDTLVPPPNPVRLVYPPDDTGYVVTNIITSVQIQFIWQAIIEAEYYEFHISVEPTFIDSFTAVYTQSYNTLDITKDTSSVGNYFWRVRASNPRWTWFTDWSEVRCFRIWYSGPPPH